MYKYTLTIGGNNDTGVVEIEKIVKIVTGNFSGFSIIEMQGFWEGKAEKSVKVEILTDRNLDNLVYGMVHNLKTELKQNTIIVEIVKVEASFV